jgi:hypothetical protein
MCVLCERIMRNKPIFFVSMSLISSSFDLFHFLYCLSFYLISFFYFLELSREMLRTSGHLCDTDIPQRLTKSPLRPKNHSHRLLIISGCWRSVARQICRLHSPSSLYLVTIEISWHQQEDPCIKKKHYRQSY